MRIHIVRIARYCICLALILSVGVFLSFLLTGKSNDEDSPIFAGPVPMKVEHRYSSITTKMTDPFVNLKLQSFRCDRLFENDADEMGRAVAYLRDNQNNFITRPDADYDELTADCEYFKRSRGFLNSASSTEEIQLPIAFNILFHRNVEQLERLIRAIYRPHNQYCIHIDGKASQDVMDTVAKLTRCFPNVFVASKLEIVIYASYTRLTADINCMKDHIRREHNWKYLINMASSEFPIMSNFQIVKILEEFNGANDIHEVFKTMDKDRFKTKHFTYIDLRKKTGHIIHTHKPKGPPPSDLTITKGNAYNIFSRRFVEFALEDWVARDLLAWSADTLTPDEHYWATLNNLYSNPFLNTPGGYKGHPDQKPFFGRYIGWNNTQHVGRCRAGHYVHNICVFSVQDISTLKERHELIGNKFDIEYDPIAYKCMEEWLFNKTMQQTGISHSRFYRKISEKSNI